MGQFDAASQALPGLLSQVAADWPGSRWEWDDRLTCALSTVAKAGEARAHAALVAQLPTIWTAASLSGAPVLIKGICARTGGLMARQLAFSAALPDGVFAYALWWPWGGGANVSVRLGVSHDSVLPALRAVFSV